MEIEKKEINRIIFADRERKPIQRMVRGEKAQLKIDAYHIKDKLWFAVSDGDGNVIKSINARYVLQVEY